MKKVLLWIAAAFTLLLVASCSEGSPSFDEELLFGKWQDNTLFYKYAPNHTGVTWDTHDDVTEAEGIRFEWSLLKADLTHIMITEIDKNNVRAAVPKVYTVMTLTEDQLVYKDSFGQNYYFKKVK